MKFPHFKEGNLTIKASGLLIRESFNLFFFLPITLFQQWTRRNQKWELPKGRHSLWPPTILEMPTFRHLMPSSGQISRLSRISTGSTDAQMDNDRKNAHTATMQTKKQKSSLRSRAPKCLNKIPMEWKETKSSPRLRTLFCGNNMTMDWKKKNFSARFRRLTSGEIPTIEALGIFRQSLRRYTWSKPNPQSLSYSPFPFFFRLHLSMCFLTLLFLHYSTNFSLHNGTLMSGERPFLMTQSHPWAAQLELSLRRSCRRPKYVTKLPYEWKHHLRATMPHILTFLFHSVIPMLTSPHQLMRASKHQYVPKLYDVRKNGLTCLDSRDATIIKVL